MNIDLEQFKYVGELQITNDIENQSVTVYNRIDREPRENLITVDDEPKDDAQENEYDLSLQSQSDNLSKQLENDEIDPLQLYTQQNEETADGAVTSENASNSQDEIQTEYVPESHESANEPIVFENVSDSHGETIYLQIEGAADAQQEMNVKSQHRPGPSPSGPYICENCGKSFKFKSRLKKHQDQESGLKPYKCPLKGCDSAFSLKNRLKEHMQKSHLKPKSEIESIIGEFSGHSKKS